MSMKISDVWVWTSKKDAATINNTFIWAFNYTWVYVIFQSFMHPDDINMYEYMYTCTCMLIYALENIKIYNATWLLKLNHFQH